VEQKIKPLERNPSSIENKMEKFKKQALSASTSSLLKQYRVSSNSNNSTGSTLNILKRTGGSSSSVNFNNHN
jgi:hypothetical protein